MVNMMLWTALSLSAAAVQGSVIPRQDTGDVDLAAVIRNSPLVQRHLKSTKRHLGKVFPYSEGLMEASKDNMDEEFKDRLDHMNESERKCLYVRNSIKAEGLQSFLDVNPNPDSNDRVTGDKEEKITISTSTAKINTERLGWNKEVSKEIGASVTAGASAGIGAFSASLSTTVYGNQRTTGGQNGEASTQTEYRVETTRTETCPPNSICRFMTWTYTRTLKGKCTLTPYYDGQCANSESGKNKYSLGLFPECRPPSDLVGRFYQTYKGESDLSGYGPEFQGIKMHKKGSAFDKFNEDCTFSYALRDKNGKPVSATANIIEKGSDPEAEKMEVTKVPKAIEWRTTDAGDRVCVLEDGWFWMPGNAFWIPPENESERATRKWAYRDDLPEPQGRKEKCPEAENAMAKRAEDLPPLNNLNGPPLNDLLEVVIVKDDMPEFIKQLSDSNSEGFVANHVDEAQPVARANYKWTYGSDTVEKCLAELVRKHGRG